MSELKYLWYVLDKSGTYVAKCRGKVTSWRNVAGDIMLLLNTRGLQLECTRVLNDALLMPVLFYGSETMI